FNEEATFYEDHLDSPTDDQGQRATPPFDNTFARQGNSSTSAILMAQAGDCYPLIDPPPNALTTLADCQNGPDAGGVRITGQANVASLDPDGFTLDWTTNELVNLSALTNEDEARLVYVALGNEPPTVYYRSIGTAADYSVGSVTVVNGSTAVSGVGGTQWLTNNRGTGDRININGTDYMVLGPVTEDTLTLSKPFVGIGGTYPYVLARQFPSLQSWEDCVSFATPCTYFPVASNNLVTDDRSEVGVAYKETVFSGVTIDGSVTDATHTIALTATPENWHKGMAGAGVRLNNGANGNSAVSIFDDFVRVEFLEIFGGSGSASGIAVDNISGGVGANGILLRNNLVHNVPGNGLALFDGDQITDAYNNIAYSTFVGIRVLGGFQPWARIRLLNNTLYNNTSDGVNSSELGFSGNITLDNNIAATNPNGDFVLAGPPNAQSGSNMSTDPTAAAASPFNGGFVNMNIDADIQFVNRGAGDLHIQAFSAARNNGLDRSLIFATDIDGAARFPGSFSWDIGADEQGATTLVTLRSFAAQGFDGGVNLKWETASELDNLGFHVNRATSEGGPYERVTTSLIPGLGSSPAGARYSYRDSGLENGLTYFFKLEDVETTGRTTLHGPVSATPLAGVPPQDPTPEGVAVLTYGDPRAADLRILSRSPRELVLELTTPGFEALPGEDGSVRLRIPGFLEDGEPGSPAVPYKRTWVEGATGRRVRLISAAPEDVEVFGSLRPQAASAPTVIASPRGAVRAGRARSREDARFHGRGYYPEAWARLVSEGYQGESKKALVELSPLRWDREREELVLARKLTVRLAFAGSEARHRDESGPK
ncbi:MAG TPA: right-handed parallel beta-helix repeat-containing protein, partial [Vicinamibacteria bacterium]